MKADDLSCAIENELEDYLNVSTDTVREVVDEISDKGVDKLKLTSPKKTGGYARSWKSKTTFDTATGKTKTIFNSKGQLTHLLENGHVKQNGGRVSGIPHIAPVEAELMDTFEKTLKERL